MLDLEKTNAAFIKALGEEGRTEKLYGVLLCLNVTFSLF